MIHITLTTNPRAGTITIHGETWTLVTWHTTADRHMQATTSDGENVTFWAEGGEGGLVIGGRRWTIRDGAREGATFRGRALEAPVERLVADFVRSSFVRGL